MAPLGPPKLMKMLTTVAPLAPTANAESGFLSAFSTEFHMAPSGPPG